MKMKTYILLDRSGSMGHGWDETKSAISSFVKKLKGKARTLLAAFDSQAVFDVVFDGRKKDWDPEKFEGIHPRSSTPLYDAVGRLHAKIMKDAPKKAQIVIMTDGYENSSHEITQATAKAFLAEWEKLGYDVIFLGASFEDVGSVSWSMGVSGSKTVNMATSDAYGETMSALATRNTSYASGETSASDDLGHAVRAAADGKKKEKAS